VSEESYFECLRCGKESRIQAVPPRCEFCNSGTGIVRTQDAAEDAIVEATPKGADPIIEE
jgi:hypothetical protein